MKKVSATLFTALALTALPLALPGAASAEVCGTVGGQVVNVNGCIPPGAVANGAGIVGSIAVADAIDEWHQRASGRPPCYTAQGVPYYTPGNAPCA